MNPVHAARHLATAFAVCVGLETFAVQNKTIELNRASDGRIFEGVGAVSAGASSRLLIEYPETQRAEVLDFLFRPKFGAGFQHLKVEIGGEVNSTDGIELTHMRSRDDENYERGYEWWLMKEARKRNPSIALDCLAWVAPPWIGDGNFFSRDMADYIVKFLHGAKRVHQLDINYTGIWNETPHDTEWIKLLRRTLDAAGLQAVGIVAADNYADHGWKIVDDMLADPELYAAVAKVGVHYRESKSPASAQDLGRPIWSSEDGPWRGDWIGATRIARTLNRNYVTGRITNTQIWSPVTSYYDSLPIPCSGVMRANEPWSGHYEVQPAVWAVAHTTQFAFPGWRYLDSACVLIEGGSVVALASPEGADLSIIIETMDAQAPQTLEFRVPDLAGTPLAVWTTSDARQFERLADIDPTGGVFTLSVEPGSIYSLTTTTGQSKGKSSPPPSAHLPLPYQDDFSGYRPGDSPRLFSDQSGVFEVRGRDDGPGNVLRQVCPREGIAWHSHLNPKPETLLGDVRWADYIVRADVRIPVGGYVILLGRVSLVPQNDRLPNCYLFKLADAGEWELRAIRTHPGAKPYTFDTAGDTGAPLTRGHLKIANGEWHRVGLGMVGDEISVYCDGERIGMVRDATHARGQAGIGCDWSGADFARFAVTPADPAKTSP